MKRFKVGIIGCGFISNNYIADIKRYFPDLEICAVADVDINRAKETGGKFGIVKALTPEELLADSEPEIVINLTPPQFHFPVNKAILNAGKHLFTEKPFAFTLSDANATLELAREKGLSVGCAPDTFLFSGLQSMNKYVRDGLIGKPLFVTANMVSHGVEMWHPNPAPFYAEGGGPLYDMAAYYLSEIVTMLGPVAHVSAVSGKGFERRRVYSQPHAGEYVNVEIPTHYSAVLGLRSGVVVSMNMSFDVWQSGLPKFEVYGTDGMISYPDPNFGGGVPSVYRKEQEIDTIYQDNDEYRSRAGKCYELPELYHRVANYARGIGVLDLAHALEHQRPNRASGEMARHIVETIECMIKSAETNTVYALTTDCAIPEPIEPGLPVGEL